MAHHTRIATLVGIMSLAAIVPVSAGSRAVDAVDFNFPTDTPAAVVPPPVSTPRFVAPAPTSTSLHGNPDSLAAYWVAQSSESDCVEMAAADMVGQVTGSEPAETDITGEALAIGVYDPSSGTDFTSLPRLLAQYGVDAVYSNATQSVFGDQPSLELISQDLDSGRAVAVSLDAETIWNAVWNVGAQDPGTHDHTLVVTGVDTGRGVVYLNDSGIDLGFGAGREEAVPVDVFMNAWATSNDGLVVTSPPAPAMDVPSLGWPSFLNGW